MANKVCIAGVNTAKLPKLKNSDLMELMLRVKSGDELARDEFVVANLRLVLSVVQRFGGKREKADDMFQVGCVGLMKSIDNFDTTLGVRFSTYAVPMIIGEIRRFLRDNNALRVSRSLRDTAYKALQAREQLSRDGNDDPSLEEIAEFLQLPVSAISFSLDAISDTVSLSDPIYTDNTESTKLMDQLTDDRENDNAIMENFVLKEALSLLGGREKEILTMRYFVGKTQMEVSTEVGISQAQVSRLEKNALDFIKSKIM